MTNERVAGFTITHPPVDEATFKRSGQSVVREFDSAQNLLAYYDDTCAPAAAQSVLATYQKLLREAGVAPEDVLDMRSRDVAALTAPATLGKVLAALPRRREGRIFGGLGPMWDSYFYEHANKRGARFGLNVGSGVNFIANLDETGWSDRISSVDTGLLIPVTVLGRDPYFFGGIHVLVVDQPNLGGWNDRASAVAVGTVPPQVIISTLSAIFGFPL